MTGWSLRLYPYTGYTPPADGGRGKWKGNTMKKYEVQVQVNSWAFISVEAENEQEAEKVANATPWNKWTLDTDFSNYGETTITEQEEVNA